MKTRFSSVYLRTLVLGLLVLSLGCISGETPQASNAKSLGISYFKPDIETVSEEGRIVLAMLIYNGGLFPATNVNANLYLHGGFEGAEWERSLGSLHPADIELGTSGESKEVLWDMKAPKLIKGEDTYPFNFKAIVSFDYKSSTTREIPILIYERVLELKQSGRGLPAGVSTSLDGPVTLRIASDEPIVRENSDDFKEFEIKAILTNTGNGYVKDAYKPAEKGECFGDALGCVRRVSITIPEGLEFGDCAQFEISGKTATASEIKLIDGRQAVLSCGIKVSTTREEYTPVISGEVVYRYNLGASSRVTVIK